MNYINKLEKDLQKICCTRRPKHYKKGYAMVTDETIRKNQGNVDLKILVPKVEELYSLFMVDCNQ